MLTLRKEVLPNSTKFARALSIRSQASKKPLVVRGFNKRLKKTSGKHLSGDIRNDDHTRVEIICVVVFLCSGTDTFILLIGVQMPYLIFLAI